MANEAPTSTPPDVVLVPVPAQGTDQRAALPTYQTVADVLEKKNGSGWRLAGWTVARTALIAAPMLVVGIDPKKALAGSLLASGLISVLTLARIDAAGKAAGVQSTTLPPEADVSIAVSGARAPYRGRGYYGKGIL